MTVYVSCADLCSAGLAARCCNSCHEDAEEFGYPLLGMELDLDPDWEIEVCCSVRSAWLALEPADAAAILGRLVAAKEGEHAPTN